ncbi:MAG: hypothetical protein M3Z08_14860 [Chloroflexota bacterium]|nr:hypothetical protein [Chloroflexota bacterium]
MSEKQPRFCHLCGDRLQGAYLVYGNGLAVCERCERNVPHCSQCQAPSRQLTIVRGAQVCPDCLQKLPVCACCREPVLGNYYIIGDSPLKYCETCVKTRPRCDICRAPLDAQGKMFQGRGAATYRCASCFSTAVTTGAEAQQLYRATFALLTQKLDLRPAHLPALHLVERAILVDMHKKAAGLAEIVTASGAEQQHLLGFFRRVDDDWQIYIEQLLPRTLFQAVAAHELAHAWQATHAPATQPPEIVEGFAEWVAYSIMLILGEQRAAAHLTRRNDLYGRGLQYFMALERSQGRPAVLQRAAH